MLLPLGGLGKLVIRLASHDVKSDVRDADVKTRQIAGREFSALP